ncbi:50S ribosomal protein L23 [Candidatus Aenigmatarchaeota archaeon]
MVEKKTSKSDVVVKKPKNEKKKKDEKKRSFIGKKEKFVSKKDPYESLRFVLMTERAIQVIESQNKLAFVVRRTATKKDIKEAIQTVFQTSVSQVNTIIDQKGRKKAFVKFEKEHEAGEIAIRLGII